MRGCDVRGRTAAPMKTPLTNIRAPMPVTQPQGRACGLRACMGNLPTRSGNGAAADAPTTRKPPKDEQIAGELKATGKAIAALLGAKGPEGEKRIAAFSRAAHSHFLATRDRSDKDKAECEAIDPKSYVKACLDAANQGLLPDGRDGWIVCRKGIAAWTPSWRGLVKIMRRAVKEEGGDLRKFHAEIVYRQEIDKGAFDVDLSERTIKHRPWYLLGIELEPDWTDVVLVYAAASLVRDGIETHEFRILTIAEINARARASGNPYDEEWSQAWTRWPRPMAKKSAVRALMDQLPTPDSVYVALGGVVTQEAAPALSLADRVRAQPMLDVAAREDDAPDGDALAREAALQTAADGARGEA